jgi:hypothetical protein
MRFCSEAIHDPKSRVSANPSSLASSRSAMTPIIIFWTRLGGFRLTPARIRRRNVKKNKVLNED